MQTAQTRVKRQLLSVQVVLTEEMVAQLDAEAELQIDSRSRIIREAVREYLDRKASAVTPQGRER